MNTSRLHVLRHIMVVLIAVSVLTAAFPRPAQAATCAERYTVKEGDTKSSIARHFDMDWEDIADASDIDPSDRIRPGQRLCIPDLDEDDDTSGSSTCAERYTVRDGDTKSSIARRFDMDWDDIADASDIDPSDRIRPGQRLCIPEIDDDERPNANVRLRASATHQVLTLTISGLTQKKAVFITRVRDANVGTGGFTKLGNIKVTKGDSATKRFTIPDELLDALYLQVCIKNASTDEMRCQTVIHP